KRNSIFRQIKGSTARLPSRDLDRTSRSRGNRFVLSDGDTADYHQSENDRIFLSHIAITKRGHVMENVVGNWNTLLITFRSIKDALGRAADATGGRSRPCSDHTSAFPSSIDACAADAMLMDMTRANKPPKAASPRWQTALP